MIINPQLIIDQNIIVPAEGEPEMVVNLEDPECQLQQNGIDLRLSSACEIDAHVRFSLHKKSDEKPRFWPVKPDADDFYTFSAKRFYSIDFMEYINPIPADMSATIVVRSSINRYSGMITTGWWDAGFEGRLGAVFRPDLYTEIQRGVRMCQIIFFPSDSARLYQGQYLKQSSHSNYGRDKEDPQLKLPGME